MKLKSVNIIIIRRNSLILYTDTARKEGNTLFYSLLAAY